MGSGGGPCRGCVAPRSKALRRLRSSSFDSSRSGPCGTLLDDLERDLFLSDIARTVGPEIDASSDDEPLMRPSSGRHVVP